MKLFQKQSLHFPLICGPRFSPEMQPCALNGFSGSGADTMQYTGATSHMALARCWRAELMGVLVSSALNCNCEILSMSVFCSIQMIFCQKKKKRLKIDMNALELGGFLAEKALRLI